MKLERRIPAWLLPVMSALAGMFACIWLFVAPLIAEGFRLVGSGKPDQRRVDTRASAHDTNILSCLWSSVCPSPPHFARHLPTSTAAREQANDHTRCKQRSHPSSAHSGGEAACALGA